MSTKGNRHSVVVTKVEKLNFVYNFIACAVAHHAAQ